jgi:hemerythrin-like domain-containing protein
MTATAILMHEHQLIFDVLTALDVLADRVAQGIGSRDDLGLVVEFLRGFADEHHHGKEEGILFEAMTRAGFPGEGGPIAVMRQEHDLGREHLRELAAGAAAPEAWSSAERDRVVHHARAYTSLLRTHIRKEDTVLFPMADRQLAGADADAVATRLGAFERARAVERRRLEAIAADLVRRYAPSAIPRQRPAHSRG